MKKITAILAVILSATIYPVNAATPKVMAIIDTGVDMSVPSISSHTIYEVCVSGYNSCPNGTNLQEGAGSATITPAMYSNTAWSHGTYVESSAIATDPNVKIIEIRCASLIGTNGYIGCNNDMMNNALNWISNNAAKFNIGAVVSPISYPSVSCTNPVASFIPALNKLITSKMPLIFPTGNMFSTKSVDFPSCYPGVLAITAFDQTGRLALYANYSARVDFAALGNMNVIGPKNIVSMQSGTSLSVSVFGAQWLQIANAKNLSYSDEYTLAKNTGTYHAGLIIKPGFLDINIAKALQ